jgi:hypothetical protein
MTITAPGAGDVVGDWFDDITVKVNELALDETWRQVQTASVISTNAGGHVETFGASAMITATLISGARYYVHYRGSLTGVVGDACYTRLRYKAGATVNSTGTQLTGGISAEYTGATGSIHSVVLDGEFVAPSSAQYTVGVSIDWYAGGANDISLYAGAGVSEPLLRMCRVALP